MRFMTEEELERSKQLMAKMDRKIEKREKIKSTLLSGFHAVFYTPLAIAFHAVAFISRSVGCIASLGLPFGVYYAYKFIQDLTNGIPFKESENLETAAALLALPFIVFAIAAFTGWVGDYFENNNF